MHCGCPERSFSFCYSQDSTAAYGFGVFKWKEHSTVDLLLAGR